MDTIEATNTLANLKRYISGGGVVDRKASEAINMAICALEVTANPDTVSKPQIHCKDCKHCYPPLTAVVDNEVKEVSDFRCSRMFGFTEADGWCYMFERKSSDG